MSKQSSSTDDGSLNIAFFSVLVISLSLLFVFSEGEALPKEGESKKAVISSLEEDLTYDEKKSEDDDIFTESGREIFANTSPTYQKPQVLGSLKEEKENTKTVVETRRVRVTAYAPLDPNAKEGMCFSGDPRVTASGTVAREGIVAANFLSFGTKIRIPSLFGERVFTVEDRMSSRFTNTVDVVVSSRNEAINFGTKNAYIEIVR